jgi:hypothetical protein
MNCEDFNNIIDDLADYRPMSATIRDAGVSHAALCSECAAKLSNVRAVGGYLMAAARAESEVAPASVKENLLLAFGDFQRQQAIPAHVVDISSRRNRRSWIAAAAAVAAVILLAMLVSVWRNAATPGTEPQPLQVRAPDTSVPPPVNAAPSGSSPVKENTLAGEPGLTAKNAGRYPRNAKRSSRSSDKSIQKYETIAQNAGQFVPLTYLAQGMAMDSGTVVRVELSRAALASLGFTGGVEGSAESVKADVILGDDGVARAIRLVE